jgi:thiol-disulfide isomerase/thioredoxin
MTARLVFALILAAATAAADLVREVRAAIHRNDLAGAERLVAEFRAREGVTPELLEGLSWLGRGALGAGDLEAANRYAAEVRKLALEMLKTRPLDAEKRLPIALGASIEVQAQVLARQGAISEAIAFLNQELERWGRTSIRMRIQKNINLLTLEGKPAPPLEVREFLGARPQPLDKLRGRPVLLFLWAHWCGDCKGQVPVLARLQAEFGRKGLTIVAPTQRYGYAAGGQEASPEEELRHIAAVWKLHYAALGDVPVPVSEKNFQVYGVSTTPTLVLIDAAGVVRLYHPGKMSYEELAPRVAALAGS